MKDRFPKWWLPYYVVRTLFLRFGVITLVLLAPLFTLYVSSGDYVIGSDYIFLFSLWFMLFAPFIINYGIANNRKKKILAVIEKIKDQAGHQLRRLALLAKYLSGFRLPARNVFVHQNLSWQRYGCHWFRCLQPYPYRG